MNDAQRGMQWWNALTPLERAMWLRIADSAAPADAWAAFKASPTDDSGQEVSRS